MVWPSPHGQEQTRNGRVLVVADNANFRRIISRMLNKDSYDVIEAEDGAHAFEILRASPEPSVMDVIICDIRMPHMNGMEAVTTFRQEFPSIPVIVLAGFPDRMIADSLLDHGVVEYRPKPIERDKVLAFVAKAMEQRLALKGLTVIAASQT